ncbi:Flp family type IVb pilin [Aurantiacibacter sp. MUD11]|uniref:Flp family type IVb pilin n=1 Tax=Aurantiacibacter sp. MUD11 TaxID=3003265 RepID=UPI0022AA542A|nr:Flp family type IVb pilin [Aurantiacibacter sp. MUD11]WAT18558.1 Flp family type IVb pilin [Aurantiacibacter sp. MUD11]
MFAKRIIYRLLRDTRGATAIEYGLIISLIVIAMISAMQGFANSTISMWDNVETEYETANSGS